MKSHAHFIVAGDVNFSLNHCCATLDIFVWLTVTCSSTTHKECVVLLPVQQWLPESATMYGTRTLPILSTPSLSRYCSFSFRHSESHLHLL